MLTIFTPAYNRAGMLPRLYRSLCDQSNQDFEWLIIDDGSSDETAMVVKAFIDEAKINIRYLKKENGEFQKKPSFCLHFLVEVLEQLWV